MLGRIIVVNCPRCGGKVLKYLKIGRGRLLRLWKDRIVRDYSIHEDNKIKCPICGYLIGVGEGRYIRVRHRISI